MSLRSIPPIRLLSLTVVSAVAWSLAGGSLSAVEPKAPQAAAVESNQSSARVQLTKDPYQLYCASLYSSAKRGAKWLQSAQREDGLFVYGWVPGLNRPLPDNNYLRQAGASAALARAAGVTQQEELLIAARQAIVVLLASYTEADPNNSEIRRPTLFPADANPVGFSGLVLLAISELPNPGDSLLDQGEQIARFIASRQRPDGSLNISASLLEEGEDVADGVDYYPGEAMYALMRSHTHKPAPWKVEVVTKAFDYYHRHWKEKPSSAFIPWQSGAYAEAYLLTGEARFAEFVLEMNDWLLALQYVDPSDGDGTWMGGFGSHQYGHVLRTTPGATTASYAESVVEAYRVAKMANDAERMKRYRRSADLAFQFLMANQYSFSAHPHYKDWFLQKINGAFHASVVDGTVRIDFNQHAINGMFHYLSYVAEYQNPDQAKHQIPPGLPRAN